MISTMRHIERLVSYAVPETRSIGFWTKAFQLNIWIKMIEMDKMMALIEVIRPVYTESAALLINGSFRSARRSSSSYTSFE